jgi:charged multivesicular body protein 2A
MMGNLFGKEKPLKEILRENKRMIQRAIREIDRERYTLEQEEKRIVRFSTLINLLLFITFSFG